MKVYFDGSLYGGHANGHKCAQEIDLDLHFVWNGARFFVPALYLCAQGVVVDVIKSVDRGEVAAYLQKYAPLLEKRPDRKTELWAQAENPLRMEFDANLMIGKNPARVSHSSSAVSIPKDLYPQEDGVQEAFAHYGCDEGQAHAILRLHFPWQTKRRPKKLSLALCLSPRPCRLPVEKTFSACVGCAPFDVPFTHPQSGQESVLHVLGMTQEVLPQSAFGREDCEYPTHFCLLRYAVDPAPAGLLLRDVCDGDAPRRISREKYAPEAIGACSIGIIGGADGPTAAAVGGREKCCASALRFGAYTCAEFEMQVDEVRLGSDLNLYLWGHDDA